MRKKIFFRSAGLVKQPHPARKPVPGYAVEKKTHTHAHTCTTSTGYPSQVTLIQDCRWTTIVWWWKVCSIALPISELD